MTKFFQNLKYAVPVALALTLTACGGGGGGETVVTPAPTPTPTPTPVASFNVQPCLDQVIPGTGGLTTMQILSPDTLTIDFSQPNGFPNGRRPDDPVIDLTLAYLFLDLKVHPTTLLASLPLNPASDQASPTTWPYLGPPQGTPALSTTDGTNFNFRTEPDSAFVQLDRMGMPAVATALIGSSLKNRYNDVLPAADATGEFEPELKRVLTALTNALSDDLQGLTLTLCAKPV